MKRLAVVLPVVLLAVACGGGDKNLSKGDYLAKAEAICTKANADVKALGTPTSPSQIVPFAESVVKIAEGATGDLKKLTPPAADKADLQKKVLTPLDTQLGEAKVYIDKLKAAVAARDQAALGKLLGESPATTQADLAYMQAYGFKACLESAKTD